MRTEWAGLRDYQRGALEAVAARRVPRGMVALATGGGKGHIAGHLMEALGTERVLYMVHRDKLVEQLYDHVRRVTSGVVGIERAESKAPPMAKTVIASVQTIGRAGSQRLERLIDRGFDALVTDECHHSTADSYCRIQAAMGLLRPGSPERHATTRKLLEPKWVKVEAPSVQHVGLTATPSRGDGIGLHLVFDEIIFSRDLRELVKAGWLVPPIGYTINTATSLDGVRTLGKGGDYMEADLEKAINVSDRHAAIFDGWRKAAEGKRTLAFCATIQHAQDLAAHFEERGVEATSIDGTMSRDEQEIAYRWFAATPGAVMMSCQLIGEGVDLPHVEAVLMARPTRSATVYAQCTGRGTRLARGARDYDESVKLGKAHVIVLDVTDSIHDAGKRGMTIGKLVGAPWPDEIADGENVIEETEEQEVKQKEQARIGAARASLKTVQMLGSATLPKHFGLAWIQAGESYLLALADGLLRLATDALDRWTVERMTGKEWAPLAEVAAHPEQQSVVKSAEEWYRKAYPGASVALVDRSARWRANEPSEAALKLAARYRCELKDGATAGDVSDAINAAKLARGESVGVRKAGPVGPGPCPKCEGETRERAGQFGRFYGCVNYSDGCRGTREYVTESETATA